MIHSFLNFLVSLILVFSAGTLTTHGKEIKEKLLTFSSSTLPPASGNKPDSIVVLFHGYGDTGKNFVLLGHLWRELLPNTLFVAPDAPRMCKDMSGKQWISVGNKNPSRLLKELHALTPSLNRYLDDLLKTYGLPPEKLALVGFSQGVRVALHIGLRRPCSGIVAYSGAFVDDPTEQLLSHPPVLLIHGMEDSAAPFSLAQKAEKALKARHIPVTLSPLPELGHEIDPRGLELGAEFLKECLYGRASCFRGKP
jgi:phospholipase/carboxylesterase